MSDFNSVATAFVKFYYDTFDSNRAGLSSLYREESMLSYEGANIRGQVAIVEKLTSLPFTQIRHHIDTFDAQPGLNGSVVVFVTGKLMVDDSPAPLRFCQVFQLVPVPGGQGFFCYNDVFRLVYG
eukprot:TRINITY_DN431_c0_g1_i1.p1 TRINITY_DN431_c0_g1~~TRINITY_DN431_c0_g1_i1.p1  ORF type:complete len:125 (-),score=17.33 TRINITY_DN431_c0_g1_i1:643-1017(-)